MNTATQTRRRRNPSINVPPSEPQDPVERERQVADLNQREKEMQALKSHRARVGHLAAAMRNVKKTTEAVSDFAAQLCRTVFGRWGAGSSGSARSSSQNLAVFQGADGSTQGHAFNTKISEQFSRMRCIGIWSLFVAQRNELLRWFKRDASKHCILLQIADDVNVWVRGNQNSSFGSAGSLLLGSGSF